MNRNKDSKSKTCLVRKNIEHDILVLDVRACMTEIDTTLDNLSKHSRKVKNSRAVSTDMTQ